MTSPTEWTPSAPTEWTPSARVEPPSAGWTADDLDRLVPSGHRRELIDGVVLAEPAPGPFHDGIGVLLSTRISALCPPGHSVLRGVTVRFSDQRCFVPDVAVIIGGRRPGQPEWLAPREILIAIEIVGPTSLLMDRVTKPALYAAAGIPYYWRVETDGGVEVCTYRLDLVDEVYRLTGEFRNTIDVPAPWPIRIPVGEITP